MKKLLIGSACVLTIVGVVFAVLSNRPLADNASETLKTTNVFPVDATPSGKASDTPPSDSESGPLENSDNTGAVARYAVRFSNIDGSIEELLQRESAGDARASYELVARTNDCLLGLAKLDCDYYRTTVSESAERLQRAAASGVVAAQINYLGDFGIIDPADRSEDENELRVKLYVGHLNSAKFSGSADALYLLGLMAITGSNGGPRMDVEESIAGLSRLDAVAHLMASAEIFSQLSDNTFIQKDADLELAALSPREVDQVRKRAKDLLSSAGCCFVTKRKRIEDLD